MKTKPISELERQVMEVLWTCRRCSVRDVQLKLHSNHPLAYTTVATLLTRLTTKGLVKREVAGIVHVYTPRISPTSYTREVANSFLKKFVGSFGDVAIASFADSIEKLPKEKKAYFLKLLKEYETQS